MISQFDTLDIDVKNYGIYGNWTKQEFLESMTPILDSIIESRMRIIHFLTSLTP